MSDCWLRSHLRKLTDTLLDHPRWFVVPQLALLVFCAGIAAQKLTFTSDRADLVSESVKYQRDFREFKREFQSPDSLFAAVESESPEKNRLFIESLSAKVRKEPHLFANTLFKGDLDKMGRKGLLFLSPENLEEIARVFREDWAFIETVAQSDDLNSAFRALNREFRHGLPISPDAPGAMPALRLFHRAVDYVAASLDNPVANSYPDLSALLSGEERMYLNFDGGRIFVLVTHAARPSVEEKAVTRLWELVRQTQTEISGVNAGITGEPALNYDEMREATHDINWATVVSLVLVALIFIAGFHEIARPLLATFCLLVGIVYALGFTALTVGRLNILSITLVPILTGIAIDFGVHFISRYEEELSQGRPLREALRRAYACTGVGILTSALTIAGGFFAMMLTDFKGIQEMGFIAGASLLLCLVPMLTLLPLLLAHRDRKPTRAIPRVRCPRQWIERTWLRRPALILGGAATLTALAATQLPNLRFDYNLLNLQSADLPAVRIERQLIQASSYSLLHGVVLANSLDEAVDLQARLEKLAPVAGVTSMVNYLRADYTEKLRRVAEIKARIASLPLRPAKSDPVDLAELNQTLFALQGYLGWAPYFLDPSDSAFAVEIDSLRNAVGALRSQIILGSDETAARLTGFQQGLFANVRELAAGIRQQDTRRGLAPEDLPAFLRERFISRNGTFLLQVHPKADLWQRANQEEFIRAVRTVAPNVTGSVVQIHEYTGMLKSNFLRATAYAAALIALILFIQFRRLGPVLLAFFPVALGVIWMLGLMGFLDMPFNPANIMALTLLTGIGVANGIHILVRSAQDHGSAMLSKSTGKAVLVSAFTTMAGFGSLLLAKHQGIASLGAVMAMGAGLIMIAALAVLPALLAILKRPVPAPAHEDLPLGMERLAHDKA